MCALEEHILKYAIFITEGDVYFVKRYKLIFRVLRKIRADFQNHFLHIFSDLDVGQRTTLTSSLNHFFEFRATQNVFLQKTQNRFSVRSREAKSLVIDILDDNRTINT